jgi:hypothetical protein
MNRDHFDHLVKGAEIMPANVTERTWREIARVGYQLLELCSQNERDEILPKIERAESMVDHPTRVIRQNHMEALGLHETDAGYRVALDYLLELMTVFDGRQEGKIPESMLLDMFEHYLQHGRLKGKEGVYRRIDMVLGQKEGYTKNRFKTINKHREKYNKAPS